MQIRSASRLQSACQRLAYRWRRAPALDAAPSRRCCSPPPPAVARPLTAGLRGWDVAEQIKRHGAIGGFEYVRRWGGRKERAALLSVHACMRAAPPPPHTHYSGQVRVPRFAALGVAGCSGVVFLLRSCGEWWAVGPLMNSPALKPWSRLTRGVLAWGPAWEGAALGRLHGLLALLEWRVGMLGCRCMHRIKARAWE